MSSDAYCLAGIALSLAVLVFMAYMILRVPPQMMVKSLPELLDAWRTTRDIPEKLIVLYVLYRQFARSVATLVAVSALAGATSVGTAICGMNPDAMRAFRDIMNDILHWLTPERVPSPAPR